MRRWLSALAEVVVFAVLLSLCYGPVDASRRITRAPAARSCWTSNEEMFRDLATLGLLVGCFVIGCRASWRTLVFIMFPLWLSGVWTLFDSTDDVYALASIYTAPAKDLSFPLVRCYVLLLVVVGFPLTATVAQARGKWKPRPSNQPAFLEHFLSRLSLWLLQRVVAAAVFLSWTFVGVAVLNFLHSWYTTETLASSFAVASGLLPLLAVPIGGIGLGWVGKGPTVFALLVATTWYFLHQLSACSDEVVGGDKSVSSSAPGEGVVCRPSFSTAQWSAFLLNPPTAANALSYYLAASILFLPAAAVGWACASFASCRRQKQLAQARLEEERAQALLQKKRLEALLEEKRVRDQEQARLDEERQQERARLREKEKQFNRGLQSAMAGKHAEAVELFRQLGESGHAEAQFHFAIMRAYGLGTDQDFSDAMEWYLKAALQGNAEAQARLGEAYFLGHIVAQNTAKAIHWLTKAADQCSPLAYFGLAVVQDEAAAASWYTKAAERDHVDAQLKLANLYFEGSGVAKDVDRAVRWYTKAGQTGNADAQVALGLMYAHGRGVPHDPEKAMKMFTPALAQFELARRAETAEAPSAFLVAKECTFGMNVSPSTELHLELAELTEWSVKKGKRRVEVYFASRLAWAKARLAKLQSVIEDECTDGPTIFLLGTRAAKSGNEADALSWFQKGAALGNADAQLAVSISLRKAKKTDDALRHLSLAAMQDHAEAQFYLGSWYMSGGDGLTEDMAKAFEWFNKAAAQGLASAQYEVAGFLLAADDAESTSKAVDFLKAAAAEGHDAAQGVLGLCYLHGKGVPKDDTKGEHWLRKAVELGNAQAQYQLAAHRIDVIVSEGKIDLQVLSELDKLVDSLRSARDQGVEVPATRIRAARKLRDKFRETFDAEMVRRQWGRRH